MTTNPLRSTKNRFRAALPSVSLTVETRPILPGDHLYALRLVRVDPVLRWIFGYPDLLQFDCSVSDREDEVFTILRRDDFLCIESPSMDF